MSPERKFDLLLSYASEQRLFVEQLNACLRRANVETFFDVDFEASLLGRDADSWFSNLFGRHDRCVLFVSRDYVKKKYPLQEARSALQRLAREKDGTVIPVHLDDARLDLPDGLIGLDAGDRTPAEVARLILRNLGYSREASATAADDAVVVAVDNEFEVNLELVALTLGRRRRGHAKGLVPVRFEWPGFVLQWLSEYEEYLPAATQDSRISSGAISEARALIAAFAGPLRQELADVAQRIITLDDDGSPLIRDDEPLYSVILPVYLKAKLTALCRVLTFMTLVGMSPPPWQERYRHWTYSSTSRIATGLALLNPTSSSVPLWVDCDFVNANPGIVSGGERLRGYVPYDWALREKPSQRTLVLSVFAPQVLDRTEYRATQWLRDMVKRPQDLRVDLRAENFVDMGTGREDNLSSVRGSERTELRERFLAGIRRHFKGETRLMQTNLFAAERWFEG